MFTSQNGKHEMLTLPRSSKWESPKLEDLHEKCSEKVWGKFKQAMNDGDFQAANRAKAEVEEAQRERKRLGKDFVPQYFEFRDGDWHFKKTASPFLTK